MFAHSALPDGLITGVVAGGCGATPSAARSDDRLARVLRVAPLSDAHDVPIYARVIADPLTA
jgi:hypothetical protein